MMMDYDKWQREHDERCLDHSIEAFIRTWSPRDLRSRADFEMHLHSIVRMIYREAQRPLLHQLTIMASASMPNIFINPMEPAKVKPTESQPVK